MSTCHHGFEEIGKPYRCPYCEIEELIEEQRTRIRELETENQRLRADIDALGQQLCAHHDTNPLNETVVELELERQLNEQGRIALEAATEADKALHQVEALEAENRVVRELVEDALDRLWVRDKEYYHRILARCTWLMGEVEVDRSHEGRDELLARIAALTREYQDYQTIADHCTKVYDHFSGGRISKPFTLPAEVIAVAQEVQDKDFEAWHQERLAPIKERLREFVTKYDKAWDDERPALGLDLVDWIEETFKEPEGQ